MFLSVVRKEIKIPPRTKELKTSEDKTTVKEEVEKKNKKETDKDEGEVKDSVHIERTNEVNTERSNPNQDGENKAQYKVLEKTESNELKESLTEGSIEIDEKEEKKKGSETEERNKESEKEEEDKDSNKQIKSTQENLETDDKIKEMLVPRIKIESCDGQHFNVLAENILIDSSSKPRIYISPSGVETATLEQQMQFRISYK